MDEVGKEPSTDTSFKNSYNLTKNRILCPGLMLPFPASNFGLAAIPKMPAEQNYFGYGFRAALSALCAAAGNTIPSRTAKPTNATPAGIILLSRLALLRTVPVCL